LLAWGYFPFGILAVLLTASRGGFVSASIALVGSAFLLARGHPKRILAGALLIPALAAGLWLVVPYESLERLTTISEQLRGGDLNDRVNIWMEGWRAFLHEPLAGSGAGSFVSAAGLAPIDTAHNTALSLLVSGGLLALFPAVAILALAVRDVFILRGPLLVAVATALAVWTVSSLTASTEENRSTWLLLGMIALAGRLWSESPSHVDACFGAVERRAYPNAAPEALL
jgi:O-antigen ligase